MRVIALAGLTAMIGAASSAAAEDSDPALISYHQLQATRYATQSVALPRDGLEFDIDAASFRLVSGSIKSMQPVGAVSTGFVFTGKGRFHLEIPSAFERAQLRRFAHDPALESIDTAFSAMVVRSADPRIGQPVSAPTGATYDRDSIASDRRASWLKDGGNDVDARIVAAMLNPNDRYVVADVKTAEYGWLFVEFEPWNQEELTVTHTASGHSAWETWVSLDRAAERDADGNPTSDMRRLIDLEHAEIEADLGKHRAELVVGHILARPDSVKFRVRLDFVARESGVSAVPLELDPRAEIRAVRSSDGTTLPVLRDNYGKDYALIDDERSTSRFVVVLDKSMQSGERRSLEFEYDMRTLNFVSGRGWYPGPLDGVRDPHTTRTTIVGADRLQVRAAGALSTEAVASGRRTSVWVVDRPVKLSGFSFGVGFKEESVKIEGAPEVRAFGVPTGASFGKMVHNVAVDVARSQKFFRDYFDVALPEPLVRVTATSGMFGHSCAGFLQMPQDAFNSEDPGGSERLRAREVAFQYWGHLVGWKSYRDQWLSDAFAEYSALLFVESVLPPEKYFHPMINDMADFQLGSLRGGAPYRSFSLAREFKPYLRADLGPIAAGIRANTARVPFGYYVQCSQKGALVLHTIRTVLSSISPEQDLFQAVLRDFMKSYRDREASTSDFEHVLARHASFAWGPFFEAYVYGTEIPTFAWRWSLGGTEAQRMIVVDIAGSHVPKGFALPIPLAVEFEDGRVRYAFIHWDGSTGTFHIPVPERPVSVVLNPRNSVLARIEPLK